MNEGPATFIPVSSSHPAWAITEELSSMSTSSKWSMKCSEGSIRSSSFPITVLAKVTSCACAFFFPFPFCRCSNQSFFCFLPGQLDLAGPRFFWYWFPEDWLAELDCCCSSDLWYELFWFLHWLLFGGPRRITLVLLADAEGSLNSTLEIRVERGLREDRRSSSHRTRLVMVSTVKLTSSTVCVIVDERVKKSLDRRVKMIMARNDSGRFRPACVICSKSCTTLLMSSLADWGWILVHKALWNKLNCPASPVVPKRDLSFSQSAFDTEGHATWSAQS